MQRFEFELIRTESRREPVVEAETIEEAVGAVLRANPGFRVEWVDGRMYMGRCAACGKVILDGDEYAHDSEAVLYFCPACDAALVQDEQTET